VAMQNTTTIRIVAPEPKLNLKVFSLDFSISRFSSRDGDLEKSPLRIVARRRQKAEEGEFSLFQIVAPSNQNLAFQHTPHQIVAPPNHKCALVFLFLLKMTCGDLGVRAICIRRAAA